MLNFHADSKKSQVNENNNLDFSTSQPLSRKDERSGNKPFKVHPIDFSESNTQPPYYTHEEWSNICTCDCHKDTQENNEDKVDDVTAHVTKIEKNISDSIKGEAYCQSGQEECKMPEDCKWHNSSFASDYYRYRQDSIPQHSTHEYLPQLSTTPTETVIAGNKKTTLLFHAQTLCCLRQPPIKRQILPTVPSKKLKEVYQLEDEKNSMNFRPELKAMLKNTAYGMQWNNETYFNKNDVYSNVNSDNLLNIKLSLLDDYLQSQFEGNQNYSEAICNASPNAIYEMVMDQILKQSVEYRSIKIRERSPSVSSSSIFSGGITLDSVSKDSDTEDSEFDKANSSYDDNVSCRNLHFNKRTTSTSSESSSPNEETNYSSSDSVEQATSWITSAKKHEYLTNGKLKIRYENPFLHEGLFDLAQKDQNMNQVENPSTLAIKSEPVEIEEDLNEAVTVDEDKTIVITSSDGVKVVAPYQSKMARNCVNVVERTETQELERQRKNLASRISRAREDMQKQCEAIPSTNGKDSHTKKKNNNKRKSNKPTTYLYM